MGKKLTWILSTECEKDGVIGTTARYSLALKIGMDAKSPDDYIPYASYPYYDYKIVTKDDGMIQCSRGFLVQEQILDLLMDVNELGKKGYVFSRDDYQSQSLEAKGFIGWSDEVDRLEAIMKQRRARFDCLNGNQ